MRALCAASVFVVLSVLPSFAQDGPTGADASRDTQSAPIVEDLAARPPGMFAPRPGVGSVAYGIVERGQAILTLPIEHRRVGRLQNDIIRTGLVNSDRVVVPKGTPVYSAFFGAARDLRGPHYHAWCGVVAEGEARRRGYCMLHSREGDQITFLPSNGSPFAPLRLADYYPTPALAPIVGEDPSVRAEFPPLEFVVSFLEWDDDAVELRRETRVEGRIVALRRTSRAPRR